MIKLYLPLVLAGNSLRYIVAANLAQQWREGNIGQLLRQLAFPELCIGHNNIRKASA